MSSLMEDLDELMMPYRCKFDKAFVPNEWFEFYDWMNKTYGRGNWDIDKNVARFKREDDLTLFILRWL